MSACLDGERLDLLVLGGFDVRRLAAVDAVALHGFVATTPGAPVARSAAAGPSLDLVFGGTVGAFLLVDQRLPIGDRDLVIVWMDFGKGEKSVAVPAVIDERGLQRRLDPRHLGKIYVSAKLPAVSRLEVEFLDTIAAQHDHPGLFGVRRVDEHFVGH